MIQHLISDIDGVLAVDGVISERTKELLRDLQQYIPVSIATGRSMEGVVELGLDELITNGFLILENGSIIMKDGVEIGGWNDLVDYNKEEMDALYNLIKLGDYSYHKRRSKSFSVIGFKELGLLADYPSITAIQNLNSHDFIPKNAGKEAAISYLVDKGLVSESFACIGNGGNDLGMLKLAPNSFTVADASQEVLEYVMKEGFASSLSSEKGTQEVFKNILDTMTS